MSRQRRQHALKTQQEIWYARLKQDGFKDIEDSSGRLKTPDMRTIAFQNRDQILEFFLKLDSFLNDTQGLMPLHRQILTLYSEGKQVREITRIVNRSYSLVRNTIRHYKAFILCNTFPQE